MTIAAYPKYESYKHTGIKWSPEIPKHWDIMPLKFMASLKSGDTITAEKFTTDGFPVYGGNGFRGFTNRKTHTGNFVLIGRQGALCGNVNYALGDFFATEHAIVASPKRPLETIWLGEAIRCADFNQLSQSAAQPGISTEVIGNQRFPFPPFPEQRAISTFLDKKCAQIDEAVRIKEEQIKLLRERRQILIQQAVTRGLNPEAPMKDSGIDWIGQIPAHWEVKKLKYASKIFRGKFTHRPRNDPRLYDGRYPFFQTGDVARAGMFLSDYKQTLNEAGLRVSTLIPKGTILITIAANIGDVAILDVDGCFPDSVVGFRPSEAIERDFLFYSMSAMKSIFLSSSIANAQANLNVDRIGSISITLPSLSEQRSINLHVERNNAKIDSAVAIKENQITALTEYKTTLINAAVTGKIKVMEDGR